VIKAEERKIGCIWKDKIYNKKTEELFVDTDIVYFDPPYHPISKTSSFTSYTKENFGKDSQQKLFEVFKKLDKRSCKLMLSNSYSEYIKTLYKDYKIITLDARRAINCNAEKRGNINVLLILNY